MHSDSFVPCDIDRLLSWILAEEKTGQILGLAKELFFVPQADDPFRMNRYGRVLETPLGVAAGPHTQLSQNIIAAWLTGARYLELKTVQVLDELNVTKPCIDMTDEGYNCEWSQELKLDQSFGEYLNAWIVLHILKDKFGWGDPAEPGFLFNMSVGYNLEGIQSPVVQRFLDLMQNCSIQKTEKIEQLTKIYPRVKDLNIPNCISDNITISTMHGCPPDEVEKIGRYFVEERQLNTTIKLNPTLLGHQRVRSILNDQLGFKVQVPDLAFEHDLKFPDGLKLIRSLADSATEMGVEFNIKLTNTLETTNQDQNLPDEEQMVYLSGRALHPISVNLAARLQREFDGGLDISFSAGVDCFNLTDTLACGLKPVTICSDVLKPGGYGRLSQYLEQIGAVFKTIGAESIDDYIIKTNFETGRVDQAALTNLIRYADRVTSLSRYAKQAYPYNTIKIDRELPKFDCAAAPCIATCPAEQDIPRYMDFIARGQLDKAFMTVLATNPFPNVQGKVCDHMCQFKCTRLNYDDPLLIREIKRVAAQMGEGNQLLTPGPANGLTTAIIGGGPTGLTCAHFLALAGFKVDIFETKSFPGGMAADGIPSFRLDDGSLQKDIDRVLALGVTLNTGQNIDSNRFKELIDSHDYVYVAVGAQNSVDLDIPGLDGHGVIDQLDFLSRVRRHNPPALGLQVGIIGGGNSAMDAARTAKRLVGTDGQVAVIYRRTQNEMPADREEILAAMEEGVIIHQLCIPEEVVLDNGRVSGLALSRMELGQPDASGRPRPVKIEGSRFIMEIDNLIPAIGQKVVLDFFPGGKLELKGDDLETGLDNVFAGGDAVRGASSLIKAIADGKRAARAIMSRSEQDHVDNVSPADDRQPDWTALKIKQARRQARATVPELEPADRLDFQLYIESLDVDTARQEAGRCLQCDIFCNVCTTVCPNRANVAVEMEAIEYPVQIAYKDHINSRIATLEKSRISQHFQIVNLGDYCNECGNCTTFCPSNGEPYRDKPKLHLTQHSFDLASQGYFLASSNRLEGKLKGLDVNLERNNDGYVYNDGYVKVTLSQDYSAQQVDFINNGKARVKLRQAAEMAICMDIFQKIPT